jgi:16S rRNA (adenine1518-N6/adenine1519-N6)-dimethyltransferase
MLAIMNEKFETKKSLGQHFLNSAAVPRLLCDAGDVKKDDLVLEIGPGTGVLTREILARGATVIALEADRRAIEVLKRDFAADISSARLRVVETDVRKLDLRSLGLADHSFKVVANIPYYLTGHLFRVFLEGDTQPRSLVFLVQKEVGKRAAANLSRGGKESLLSLSIKAFGEPEYMRTVGKGHFTPPPKVDSAIIRVSDIGRERFGRLAPAAFFEVLHLGFGAKRKQLLGNLAKRYDRQSVAKAFEALGLASDIRAEDIDIDTWIKLAKKLSSMG